MRTQRQTGNCPSLHIFWRVKQLCQCIWKEADNMGGAIVNLTIIPAINYQLGILQSWINFWEWHCLYHTHITVLILPVAQVVQLFARLSILAESQRYQACLVAVWPSAQSWVLLAAEISFPAANRLQTCYGYCRKSNGFENFLTCILLPV